MKHLAGNCGGDGELPPHQRPRAHTFVNHPHNRLIVPDHFRGRPLNILAGSRARPLNLEQALQG
ncbi:MAG: hypothetical protein WCF57_05790 [Pyrinomonadaceae bacterium]